MKVEVGEVEESRRDDNKLSREMRESKSKEELNERQSGSMGLGESHFMGGAAEGGSSKTLFREAILRKIKGFL